MGPGRRFGVQPDEDAEILSGWGACSRLSLAMRGLLLLTLLLMVSGLVGKGVVCSRRRGRDDAVGRRRSRFGVSKRLIPGVQEAIGKLLGEFPFGPSGELFRCFFKFSAEGLKHLQLGIVLLHTVACELRGCFKNGDWLLYSSRGRVRGGVRMGDLGSFRSRSSRDCIERRGRRLSRPPVGLFCKRAVRAPRLRLAGVWIPRSKGSGTIGGQEVAVVVVHLLRRLV
ncbi:hypothetical protein BGZ61DRAFT_570244 [Ilyonectria robusta]|uniref:uncharacterized protein n=1 Tax=Ilyonectria robusta TaxID=1079257 RepID=UPI001E8D3C49|nr:uncharacterized protein BGZ61DRAFT_570244 [Ilyonectria robusta]KAH8656473.1 hypothetical protein BGZ61DRAFT_570244 [Ilyonectria robusta]